MSRVDLPRDVMEARRGASSRFSFVDRLFAPGVDFTLGPVFSLSANVNAETHYLYFASAGNGGGGGGSAFRKPFFYLIPMLNGTPLGQLKVNGAVIGTGDLRIESNVNSCLENSEIKYFGDWQNNGGASFFYGSNRMRLVSRNTGSTFFGPTSIDIWIAPIRIDAKIDSVAVECVSLSMTGVSTQTSTCFAYLGVLSGVTPGGLE